MFENIKIKTLEKTYHIIRTKKVAQFRIITLTTLLNI